MNILELDSFDLADAVKFNNELNPRIWQGNKMRPEVREKLLEIAEDFREFLGVDNLDVRDITVSGSNASYHYTPYSDIDLHLVVDVPKLNDDAIFRELFDAKKYQYNDLHNIKIGGYDVELYVEDAGKPPVSQGIFSVLNNDWINIPRQRRATVDDTAVKSKYEDIKHRIESALKDKDFDRIDRLAKKIKAYRQAGLDKHGEFGPENIAFKMLRNHGLISKLYDARNAARDAELSLNERKKKKKRVKYGFARTWGPVFDFSDSGEGGDGGMAEDATATPDGVNPTTCMFLNEKEMPNHTEIIFDFMKFVVHELDLHNVPKLKIRKDPQWSVINKSFGRYRDDLGQIDLATGNRHIMDVLRTLAHELQHRKQDERENMPPNAGATGSRFENEAHAVAGVLMRKYADMHPEYFEDVPVSESASGYIPRNKKEAAMPQYAMALSVDIKPGQTGKEANKMALKTDSQGRPGLLMKTANMIGESVPQPGPSSGAPKQFSPDAKIQTRQMTAKDIISSVPGVPYYNNVVDDWDAKDYSWGVTKKVIEYATYLKQHPETLSQLPPAIVLNGKFEDGAHRVSALWLLQQRMDPKNPLWKNAKLNVQFVQQGITEGKSHGYNATPMSQVPGEQEDDLGNQEATGPEFPPQMPAGTTKIDVTDLTDWYRLGQDISDLDDADPADYGKGPPQTVVVFPSDEAEQGYLKQFKRLGLKTHDMDPDVKGGEDVRGKHLHQSLAEELQAFKEQDLFEVKMTSKNLAKLAKDIKGVKVGLEFEMIVPNARVEDDGDMEPDYEQDERVRDIDDAVNFFDDGDYNSRNELRRLREAMQDSYWEWKTEKIDELWHGNQGWEFFTNYLDREEPFDEDEAREEATNELQAQYGDDITPEEFQTMLDELVEEKSKEYYQEQWDEQGYNYDHAREEFEEEQSDDLSEEEWLSDQGIRYASDVESSYGYVSWPYYTSVSDSEETDIERIALDFMNGIGADTVAYSSSYHGSYKKWTGNGWVLVGSEKPDDCFSIEPDGSLDGNSSDDVGLEFVSPPTPLEQVPDLMKRVQRWAGEYGVYTGKNNKTSIHTNISVPGYDLDKLDYLKAALLLGDEYVLREFDRIGNTYAAPAIEKVKQLVQQKPEKAQELLDKMKSQLNAEASKLIHSGVTNKFTSINTKDNRVEFRSPGGDYLSIIADNPQKMIDTINRMVVTLDAAMDPNKYKEEYQKKLYKVLTGQGGGREAKSGLKKEMKASDKDLLNIFSRYAAGELPKAALKSFVRQAQLERNVEKGKNVGKMWWRVGLKSNPLYGIEVVGSSRAEAIQAAKDANTDLARYDAATDFTAKPVRPYEEETAIPGSNIYRITDTSGGLIAGDEYDSDQAALERAAYWAQRRGVDVIVKNARGEEIGRVSSIGDITPTAQPIPGSTLDLQRQRAAAAQQQQGNWGIWIDSASRFANQPGEYPRGAEVPLYRFPSREAAEQWIEQQRAERPRMRTDIEVREIEPSEPLPDLFPELPGTPAAQQGSVVNYELYNRLTDEVIDTFPARNDNEAMTRLNDYRQFGAGQSSPDHFGVRRGPGVDNTAQQSAAQTNHNGPWEIFRMEDGRVMGTIPAGFSHRQAEAEIYRRAETAGYDPEILDVRPARQTPDQQQGGIVDVAGETPAATGQFTGEWKVVDPNGNEIYRFSGVGNAQSDANRVAMDWLRRNPRQMQAGVEVLPVMG